MLKLIRKSTLIFLIASLTLGLAPFTPEPHLWGKINWILGGAKDMTLMDWLDFVLHGTPWLLLITSLLLRLKPKTYDK